MANTKISNLTSAGTLTGSEVAPIVQSGSTVKATAQNIANLAIPTQTGQSGKYLTTDGTTTSWATVSGGNPTALISVQFSSPGNLSYIVQYNNTGSTFVLSVLSASGGQLQLNSSLSIINSKTFITMNAFRDIFAFPTFTTAFLCDASVSSPTDSFIQLSNGSGSNYNLTNAVTGNPFYLQIVFYP